MFFRHAEVFIFVNMQKGLEMKIIGKVQGVFFRQGVKAEAEKLDLAGWVRNDEDGSVKIVIEGEEKNLQKLVEWCKKGTEWARVEKVEIFWQKAREEFSSFVIR